ncbi:MAG: BamA/TamA family outer membrane protein [Candidatus Babeliales bacterium]
MTQKNTLSLLIFLSLALPLFSVPSLAIGYGGNFSQFVAKLPDQNASFNVSNITMESDVPFSNDEFFYLSGLKFPSTISKKVIDNAYKRLTAKNRFSTVNVDITDDDGAGKHLHISLTGAWIFKRLVVSGVLFGKQKYEVLYNIQSGEIFDVTLHEESIASIKKLLWDNGFFDGTVQAELIYGKRQKSIETRVLINQNRHYKMRNLNIALTDTQDSCQPHARMDKIKASLLEKFAPSLTGESYTKEKIADQVKKIRSFLQEQGFLNAHISMTRSLEKAKHFVDITLNIQLGTRKILRFKGNTIFSEATIRNELLGNDQPDWLFTPDIIKEQIMHEYYKRGYWHTTIKHEELATYGYLFTIKEGDPTLIEKVETINAVTLMPEITSSLWDEVLTNKTFDQALLEKSINNLQNFYLANGFWDFKIIEHRFVKNRTTGNYTIRLLVEKGMQRFWGGCTINGFKELEHDKFFTKYKVAIPSQLIPFNVAWLQEQRVFLINHFQLMGYWYADVQPEILNLPLEVPKNYPNAERLLVNWKIELGERVTFGKVIIRGNTKLPFQRIMKNLKFTEGDLWDKDKLDLSRKKLKRLDIFKSVHLFPYNMSKATSKKPIILNLVDDDPVELRAHAGYYLTSKNSLFHRRNTPKFGGSLIIKNPTNNADKFMVDGDWSLFEYKANVDYYLPSPFGISPMSQFKGYTNEHAYPAQVGRGDASYKALQSGFLLGINDEFKEDFHWGFNIGNEWLRTTHVHGNLKLDSNYINHTLPFFFMEPSLVIDKLDDRLNTTKGIFGVYSIKAMFPESRGDITTRFTLEQSFFYPLYQQNLIGAARIRFGHIFRRKFQHLMPVERFYLGGPYSVRGYDKDTVPPLGETEVIKPDGSTEKTYTIQGGSSMLNANFELRFPIYKSFGAVVFQDVGVLSQSGFVGIGDRWYPSSGFGLRYRTPLGALRFDIGWKWHSHHIDDSAYGWHLTLGEAF